LSAWRLAEAGAGDWFCLDVRVSLSALCYCLDVCV
jgi:hypothetical protein